MRPILIVPAFVAAMLCVGLSVQAQEGKKLPEKAQTVLDKATTIEIWSLEPEKEKDPNKEAFHGWKSLGKTSIQGDEKKKLLEALTKGLAANAVGARCFIPRHGLRAVNDNVTVDLVICFECSWVHVYVDKADKPEVITVDKSPAAEFDKVLKNAKIRVTEK
jgi:hypothetical protein